MRARVRAARRSPWLRYGAALAAVAFALLLTALTHPDIAQHDHSLLFAAVLVAAWFGGLGPGLLAAATGIAADHYLFVAPFGGPGAFTVDDLTRVAVFTVLATGVSYLGGSQQRALARARELADERADAADRLREQAAQLERQVAESQALARQLEHANEGLGAAVGAAQAAREQYRRLIETANEGVWTIDSAGCTTYVNRRMAEMLGYAPDEIQGRSIFDFMDAEEIVNARGRMEQRNRGLAVEHDTRFVRRDGTQIWMRAATNPIHDADGRVTGALGMFIDVTERRRAERRLTFLADASATLAASLDYEVTLESVARLAAAELAHTCAIDLVVPGAETLARVAVHSADPASAATLGEMVARYPTRIDAAWGQGKVARTGESELVAHVGEAMLAAAAKSPEHHAMLRALDLRSVITVPLTVGGRTIGALSLARHGAASGLPPRPPFDETDLALAAELARRAAVAIENARLLRASEEAEGRAEFLAAATAALSSGLGQEERLAQLADIVVPALADYCTVDAVGDDERLRRLAVAHVDRAREPLLHETGHDDPRTAATGPLATAVRTGEPQLVARPAAGWVEGAASSARHLEVVRELHPYSVIVVPLVARGRSLGVVSLARSELPERPFGPRDIEFATELGRRAALALDNARLFDAEQRARQAAERASARAHFLSEASALLSSSLEEAEALGAVSRLAVPRLADWCAVDVLDDEGRVRRVALAHADPVMVDVARELERGGPTRPDAPYGPARVIRSGETEVIRDLAAALRGRGAHAPADDERVRLGIALGLRSYVCAPLVARGRTLGAVTLATAESARLFEAEDVALAEDVARRAAVALDNARLYRAAQAANRAKGEFLATMSHELRTPLNAIGGYAELLEMGLRGPVTEAQVADIARIKRAQRHLLSLIENVLSFAKIEAARVRYDVRPHRLRDLVADLDTLIAPQLSAKTLRYSAPPGDASLAVLADAARAQQVVINLLSNAVKYTPPGGAVTMRYEADGAERAVVRVTDTGVGIPADKLEMIFEPFTQVSAGLTRDVEGTGLGLAISRELARGMGGELTVESEAGRGSTFTLALPLAPEEWNVGVGT